MKRLREKFGKRPSGRLAPWSVALVLVGMALPAALSVGQGCHRFGGNNQVVVYTSVDQVDAQPIFRYCAKQTHLKVRGLYDTEETKSTGVLNRLLAEAGHPQADLFWSGDPVRSQVLVDKGLVEPFLPASAKDIPARYLPKSHQWVPIAARARILLVNTKVMGSQRPVSIMDLADPAYKGKIAIANPLYGTTTMHAAALFADLGDQAARKFFALLKENGVKLASSNGEVKRLVASGQVSFGLTDTEDAAEAIRDEAPVAVVFPDQKPEPRFARLGLPQARISRPLGTLVIPSALVLIKGGPHAKAARKFAECMASKAVEEKLVASGSYLPLRASQVKTAAQAKAGPVTWPAGLETMALDHGAAGKALVRIQPFLRHWVGL